MIIPLLVGYAADLLLGDPRGWPHPVRFFGWCIAKGERFLNRGRFRLMKGILLTVVLVGSVYGVGLFVDGFLGRVWMPGAYVFDSVSVFFALANRTLLSEGQAVFDALNGEGLESGRRRLSWIVGRDTGKLSAAQIRLAVLESMSENLSDGVVAPLLFYAIGGVPAMLAYKMVNTLDSMIGYKREPFRLFGCFAARLDDVANFIPARVTGLLMVLVTGSWRGLIYIFRYGHAHSSPNSGYPESALAGIMHCRFGGPNSYSGVPVVKPHIGVREREIGHREFAFVRYINHAVTLVTVAGIILLDIFAL
ncbi:adenosylcobinamide-phosphate synthase CbiB [Puia sp. P3]|uniref:adenosylcobinamide-phosphate synthase CbiB n=1 Tax=Puia sp. P3 TaxID=3423952 RepID=UPI003D66EBC3